MPRAPLKKDLLAEAKKRGLPVTTRMTKAQILDKLNNSKASDARRDAQGKSYAEQRKKQRADAAQKRAANARAQRIENARRHRHHVSRNKAGAQIQRRLQSGGMNFFDAQSRSKEMVRSRSTKLTGMDRAVMAQGRIGNAAARADRVLTSGRAHGAALGFAALAGGAAYYQIRRQGGTEREAARGAVAASAPGIALAGLAASSKPLGAAASTSWEVTKAGAKFIASTEGLILNVATGGAPAMLTAGTAASAGVLKALSVAGAVASRAALPVTIGLAAYEGVRGLYNGKSAASAGLAAADSLTLGAASYLVRAGGKAKGHSASHSRGALKRRKQMAQRAGAVAASAAGSTVARVGSASRKNAAAKQAAAGAPRGFANEKILNAALKAQGKRAKGRARKRG